MSIQYRGFDIALIVTFIKRLEDFKLLALEERVLKEREEADRLVALKGIHHLKSLQLKRYVPANRIEKQRQGTVIHIPY